jgi:OOP family OmpA-OmpF porin
MPIVRRLSAFALIALAAAVPATASAASADERPAAVAQNYPGPFMVFFDRHSAVLTTQAKAILDNAAGAILAAGQGQVILAGHTDTAEPDHVALSQRRAVAVREYLMSRGVAEGMITTEAFGNTRLLVETAANVSEPQNRRTEITVGPGSGW